MSVFGILLASHLLADFPLQSKRMATEKFEDGEARMDHVLIHVGLGTTGLFLTSLSAVLIGKLMLVVGALHYLIDTRRWCADRGQMENFSIWVDQAMHVAVLAVAAEVVVP